MNAKIFNIYKEYENFTLDVSEMELPCNKIIGLVGKNGAGKTTLLKLLYGLVYSENLKIKIDQQDCSIENPLWKSKLFFSPETNVIPHMFKAKDVAKFYERFYSNWNSDEFYSYLKEFEVQDKKISELSLGNKKKLSLAAAFASNGEIIILDEPLSNIDPVERKVIKDIMLKFKEKNKCIIYSSHILPEVIELCDNILALNQGKCVLNAENKNINEDYLLELIK